MSSRSVQPDRHLPASTGREAPSQSDRSTWSGQQAEAWAEQDLIQRVRQGDQFAWKALIARYEGRLQAFVMQRLHDSSQAEDIVQETFLGFLTSLPNYDPSKRLESFLFSIASHKVIDALRRSGRRPSFLNAEVSPESTVDRRLRRASSLARGNERQMQEDAIIAGCLKELIEHWLQHGELERLKCAELLFVAGLSNQDVARRLQISEQDVANHKQFVVGKLKMATRGAFSGELDLQRLGIAPD
jgi:RNA polymerase sigma-70 factor (ECF subfamily)